MGGTIKLDKKLETKLEMLTFNVTGRLETSTILDFDFCDQNVAHANEGDGNTTQSAWGTPWQ